LSRPRPPLTFPPPPREDTEGLVLSVDDDGDALPAGEGGAKGTGVGLKNVRDRLAARFGPRGACRWGALPGGGFGVTLFMPLTRDVC
jgi:two-component system, LytTR family, sensor kinase